MAPLLKSGVESEWKGTPGGPPHSSQAFLKARSRRPKTRAGLASGNEFIRVPPSSRDLVKKNVNVNVDVDVNVYVMLVLKLAAAYE